MLIYNIIKLLRQNLNILDSEEQPAFEKQMASSAVVSLPAKITENKVETLVKKSTKENTITNLKGKLGKDSAEDKIDIGRLDFRVGRILEAKRHPDADTLYVETIDLGEETPRTVVSGLVRFVSLEQVF